jgi:hypothetical protein
LAIRPRSWPLVVDCSVLASAQTYSGNRTYQPMEHFFGSKLFDWFEIYSACPNTLAKLYSVSYLDQI